MSGPRLRFGDWRLQEDINGVRRRKVCDCQIEPAVTIEVASGDAVGAFPQGSRSWATRKGAKSHRIPRYPSVVIGANPCVWYKREAADGMDRAYDAARFQTSQTSLRDPEVHSPAYPDPGPRFARCACGLPIVGLS